MVTRLPMVTDGDAISHITESIASHGALYRKTRHHVSPVTHHGNRSMSKPVAIVCALCRQKIADALPGALARCPRCGTWSGTAERPRLPRHSPADQKRGVL